VRQAQGGPVADRIHFAGPRADIPELLQACTLLVLPSRWEGLPNVVLEAMAAGRPVVATAVEGTTELLQDGCNGVLVPPGSASALAQALAGLLDAPARLAEMGRAAQRIASQQYPWERCVCAFDELYRGLLRK
jgi:glycosyltransferase involved in cell wall biosynthesis